MMRESSSVRLTWSVGRGPSTGGWGRLAPGFPTGRRSLGVTRRQLGLVLGLLALEALSGTGLDHRARLGEFCQALLAARQFIGDRQAVGEVRAVRCLGLG